MIYLSPLLAFIFYSDWKHHRIPNWALLVAIAFALPIAAFQHQIGTALLGGLMAFVAMLLIKSFGYPIASGDIKLAGVAGIMTGHYAWAVIVLSWVLSAIIVWRERNPKGKAYPFGCSICVATIGVLIFQYLQ